MDLDDQDVKGLTRDDLLEIFPSNGMFKKRKLLLNFLLYHDKVNKIICTVLSNVCRHLGIFQGDNWSGNFWKSLGVSIFFQTGNPGWSLHWHPFSWTNV